MVKKEEILRDILLKMSYDSSKTLNENIEEQETAFTRYLDKVYSEPESATKYNKDMSKISAPVFDLVYEYRHGLLDIAAFGTMFIPVVGPFISLGLELANSALYYAEGENYSGGLALAFALIPFGEILRNIPGVDKIGVKGLKKLLQKTAIKNAKYTEDEIKVLKSINDNKKWIKTRASREVIKETIKVAFKGQPLKKIITTVYYLGKRNPKLLNISKTGLTIGGLWYSFDKLAEIYSIKNKSDINPKLTTKDNTIIVTDFDGVWDYKKEGDKYYTKKKGEDRWILTSGSSKENIKSKVFKTNSGEYKPTKQDLEIRKELEKEYKNNPNNIISQIIPQLSSTTDEEKNEQLMKAFDDAFKDQKVESLIGPELLGPSSN
jgi:hypothetical protein